MPEPIRKIVVAGGGTAAPAIYHHRRRRLPPPVDKQDYTGDRAGHQPRRGTGPIDALSKLLSGSGSVIENTYESLNRVNRLLSDQNIKTFSDSLNNLEAITAELKGREQMIDDAHAAIVSAGEAADAAPRRRRPRLRL